MRIVRVETFTKAPNVTIPRRAGWGVSEALALALTLCPGLQRDVAVLGPPVA